MTFILNKNPNISVHSLAKILCLYNDITLHYVSPAVALGMPDHVKQYVADKGIIQVFVSFLII